MEETKPVEQDATPVAPPSRWPDIALVIAPNDLLRQHSKRVDGEDLANIGDLVEKMKYFMKRLDGVGLSAIQISVPLRVFVIDDILAGELGGHTVFINPTLSDPEGAVTTKEGCLSYPGLHVPVVRPEKITITALNEKGQEFSVRAEGLAAVAIQHETDHLDGITFLQKVSKLKRDMYLSKYKKNIKRRAEQAATRSALGKLRNG